MTVFKGYMKIIGQNRMLILLYVAIFFGCTLLFQSTAGKSETSYQAEKLNIGIVDEDGGSLAESLTEYLGNLHHLIPERIRQQDLRRRKQRVLLRGHKA